MAERGSYGLGPRLDIRQLIVEAQHRWLRPAEICEILRNYQKFQITPEPPNRPPSGSLFLFDRKVLRYFRKDGHNWRKKKDGKTVKEAHEKLKVGSVDVLHCYYAHGEENENFQRRSYWLLEPDLMHIVFVHYLEVKGNKTNIGVREAEEVISDFQRSSSLSSTLPTNYSKTNSGNTDSTSPTSTLTSLCEDADSANNENLSFAGVNHMLHGQEERTREGGEHAYMVQSQKMSSNESWQGAFEQCTMGFQTTTSQISKTPTEPFTGGLSLEHGYVLPGRLLSSEGAVKQDFGHPLSVQSNWQISFEDNSLHLPKWPVEQTLNPEFAYDLDSGFFEQRTHDENLQNPPETFDACFAQKSEQSDNQYVTKSNSNDDFTGEESTSSALTSKRLLLEGEEGLQKVDSFSRWITKELGEVDDLHVQSSSGISWSTVECGNVNEESSLSPSLSQDQLFSIIDFSPKWAYTDSETEVHIIGTFLKSQPEPAKHSWSCMFGEVEVPAEVLADGFLCCYVPPHEVGRVPFYITCSNRLACSEVREFEYQEGSTKDVDITDIYGGAINEFFHLRLEKLLSTRSAGPPNHFTEVSSDKRELITKIISLKEEDDSCQTVDPPMGKDSSECEVKMQLLQRLTKEKFYSWLLHKVNEDGKGPNVLDEEGQGVLHFAAALGYDWVIKPTVTAGVSINFRDVNGWTALHWAAFFGREQTVAFLVSLGAAPGALTDPSPEYPLGRAPADLASGNGHKGISGFLAETSLTSYLTSLRMNDPNEDGSGEASGVIAVQTVAERAATPVSEGDVPDALSLRDSITAVCNAKQAADRIHQVFRMKSFQMKQMAEYDIDEYGSPDERALALLAVKTRKSVQNDRLAHAAATQIQKKFRGWKKRKEFLIIRQRIVKIQAHVRGHQVRKRYRTITWSVGILEKVILRWRRKGSGLRGFRPENKDPGLQSMATKEDDYDFLKEGRKQTEERLQKALNRVKSMAQYPEARAQYRRLLTVVEGLRETKACDMVLNSPEEAVECEEDMLDLEPLLEDEAFMSMAFE